MHQQIEQLEREMRALQDQVESLRRDLAGRNVRYAPPGGGALPPGLGRYKVLMIIDDQGGVDWDYPRFHD